MRSVILRLGAQRPPRFASKVVNHRFVYTETVTPQVKKLPFESELLKHGQDPNDMKRAYLMMAKDLHPDANRDNPNAGKKFIQLGLTYEKLLKKINVEKNGDNSIEITEEEEDQYCMERATATFSVAGGMFLTKAQKRELKKVSEDLSSGGARDGGWFAFASQMGADDNILEIGGPDLRAAGPAQALASGKKVRRKPRRS